MPHVRTTRRRRMMRAGHSPRFVKTGATAQHILDEATWRIDASEASAGGQTITNLGTGGSALDAVAGSGAGADTNDPKLLAHTGTNYVYLPGAGNYLSVPAFTTPTADLRVAVKVAMDDWTPAANANLVTQFGSSAATQGWLFAITATTGVPFLAWLDSGQTSRIASATAAPSITDGSDLWLDVTLDLDNGGQYNVTFRTSSDGSSWTQLGNVVVGSVGPTSIQAISRLGEIGSRNSGNTEPLVGKVYHAIVQDGGTTVLDVDTSVITSGAATSFTALTGQTVTINRGTSGRKAVAVVAPCWLFGTDDLLSVPDTGDALDFGASDSFTVMAVARQWETPASSALVAKRASVVSANSSVGWMLGLATKSGAVARTSMNTADGTNYAYAIDSTVGTGIGSVAVVAGVVDRNATQVSVGTGTSARTSASLGSVASTANALPVHVGEAGGFYFAGELIAAAVFRRALTAAEIATLSAYFANRWP